MTKYDHVELPDGALGLPRLNLDTVRNWIDFGLWGLLFYDDQPPWLALVECLHILYARHEARQPLFEPPSPNHGALEHEQIEYQVPLNFHLRHFLFRDHQIFELASWELGSSSHRDTQWQALFNYTCEHWKDWDSSPLDVKYLKQRFGDIQSLRYAIEVLRSTEIDAYSAKRWTSRHILPLGPNMLFADVRESTYDGDRRFMRRTGEMLYLMLGRCKLSLLEQLQDIVGSSLVSSESPLDQLAGLLKPSSADKRPKRKFRTGYLPFANLKVYDRLAEDWIAVLSLGRRESSESLDALMRLSALHMVIYILHRAHQTRAHNEGGFPPFVLDFAASARQNPVQRVAAGQFDSHVKSPRYAIEDYIERFADSAAWRGVEQRNSSTDARDLLSEKWLWPKDQRRDSPRTTPTTLLDDFRTASISSRSHSIWSVIAQHSRGAGLVEARRGVGTWYAPNDAVLEALVLANVRHPIEFREFSRRLYRRYRIVVGQEQAQMAFPGGAMSLERFKINEQRLEERLRVLRFIDRKSDACAFVVNPFYDAASANERTSDVNHAP